MKRDRQIELIKSAEERTLGYHQAWMKKPEFRDAVLRRNPERDNSQDDHKPMRKRACA
jgi:hypothetical protein